MISALDSFTSARIGENGHTELDWSNDIQEKIVQFDFQCVRTNSEGISELSRTLYLILYHLFNSKDENRKEHLTTLFKIIGKTRDINGGKGEYALAYMMIWTWYKFFPEMAKSALRLFVLDPIELDPSNTSQEPYGSWKDMKYFCKYAMDQGAPIVHPLIEICITEINAKLRQDDQIYNTDGNAEKKISLVAKWIPREESGKFGFLYEELAVNYFPEYIVTAKTEASKEKALKKCKTQYRMLCSKLNRHLDTVQIKQTAKNWAEIDHARTTSITMVKQRKAFLNQRKDGRTRSKDPDRIVCAENLRSYLNSLKTQAKEVKGKNVGMDMFASQAISILGIGNTYRSVIHKEEVDILNSQWRDNSNKKNAKGLGPMVAIVDTSGSMTGEPLHAALSLGCRVAENSILGRRVMTFSSDPTWINLENCNEFTDMISTIMQQSNKAGLGTNFYKALDMILSAIEEHRIPADEVENMILAIFSDMQMDDNLHVMTTPGAQSYIYTDVEKEIARGKWDSLFQQIKTKYADTGMRLYGKPLNPPHILFWNLRKTNGFPTLTTEAGCSMMSGFDPVILNMFCELGIQSLKEMTPYMTLMKLLSNDRYIPLEKIARQHLE